MLHTGIDLVDVRRIERLVKDPNFVARVFNSDETDNNVESLAGIFALKEAFFKATQIKIKRWNEVVVKHKDKGKPYLVFDKTLVDFKIRSIDCSISHDGDYAIACVVILEDNLKDPK